MSTGAEALEIPAQAVANRRRAIVVSVPLGLVAILLMAVLGHPLAGVLVCVGLALGAVNSWLVQRAVVRYAMSSEHHRKRRFIGGVFGRLAAISLVAVAVCLLVLPDGLGILAGLAIFQVLMLASASMPLIRELRKA